MVVSISYWLFTIYLQQLSGNSGWKVNGTRPFGSFQWKISREQRNVWKGSPVFPNRMFQTEIRVPFVQTSSLIPVSGSRSHFLFQQQLIRELNGKENVTFKMTSQFWNFLAIIPTRLTCLIQLNYPGAEFIRTAYQFRKNLFKKNN